MGLSRTVSEIDGDFCQKSQNFPTPCILRPAEEVPLELGTGAGSQKTSRVRKKFDDIFSRLDTMHQRDGRTDRRTPTPGDSKDHAYA